MKRSNQVTISGIVLVAIIAVYFYAKWEGRVNCRAELEDLRLEQEVMEKTIDSVYALQQDSIEMYRDSLVGLSADVNKSRRELQQARRELSKIQRITDPTALEKSIKETILTAQKKR